MAAQTLTLPLVHNAVAVRSGSGWAVECTCHAALGGSRLKRWAEASADSHLRVMLDLGGAITVTAATRLNVEHRTTDGYAVRAVSNYGSAA